MHCQSKSSSPAGRPEPEIREIFDNPAFSDHDSINVEQLFADVETFLIREFARIYRERHSTMSTWPSKSILSYLVRKSSGYSIYAATVINFVEDKYFRPTAQLEITWGYGPLQSTA
ncbi:hypothetical protein FB45DRAFT_1034880 [Roridomyces roridus]|uniref:Uncharacterized protein n=1 Tax=Roridomyces roridus TaxID=1738132 RepID=A0AAD7BC75_9AGAR|nr:hypothetical protein FB45DRAFT_1034880 [Roridomyces roridus]